jgi:hypothetical protein
MDDLTCVEADGEVFDLQDGGSCGLDLRWEAHESMVEQFRGDRVREYSG